MDSVHAQRIVELEGAFNVRDLGHVVTADGYVVRPGKLFRADALHRLTESDLHTFRTLGISNVVDLRMEWETSRYGIGPIVQNGVRHINAPLMDDEPLMPPGIDLPEDLGEVYCIIGRRHGARFVDVIETLSGSEIHPTVFHCTAGKDRTGMTTALIYSILGVSSDHIADDYALTDGNMHHIIASLKQQAISAPAHLTPPPASHDRAEAKSIQTFLTWLDIEFGSPTKWLIDNGLRYSTIESLRREMLG